MDFVLGRRLSVSWADLEVVTPFSVVYWRYAVRHAIDESGCNSSESRSNCTMKSKGKGRRRKVENEREQKAEKKGMLLLGFQGGVDADDDMDG